jgi:hypothetical protein
MIKYIIIIVVLITQMKPFVLTNKIDNCLVLTMIDKHALMYNDTHTKKYSLYDVVENKTYNLPDCKDMILSNKLGKHYNDNLFIYYNRHNMIACFDYIKNVTIWSKVVEYETLFINSIHIYNDYIIILNKLGIFIYNINSGDELSRIYDSNIDNTYFIVNTFDDVVLVSNNYSIYCYSIDKRALVWTVEYSKGKNNCCATFINTKTYLIGNNIFLIKYHIDAYCLFIIDIKTGRVLNILNNIHIYNINLNNIYYVNYDVPELCAYNVDNNTYLWKYKIDNLSYTNIININNLICIIGIKESSAFINMYNLSDGKLISSCNVGNTNGIFLFNNYLVANTMNNNKTDVHIYYFNK